MYAIHWSQYYLSVLGLHTSVTREGHSYQVPLPITLPNSGRFSKFFHYLLHHFLALCSPPQKFDRRASAALLIAQFVGRHSCFAYNRPQCSADVGLCDRWAITPINTTSKGVLFQQLLDDAARPTSFRMTGH